ncbi:MAG: DUF368 domain-containing protein [Oscillospiraceae bacterium]
MKNNFILVLKGFVMGLANLIPGVSGGTLAITLGIYERLIDALSNLFSKIKENLKFVVPLLIGVAIAFLTLSGPISYCLEHFIFATILFFVGAILGGMPMLCKKLKGEKASALNVVILLVSFAFVIFSATLGGENVVSFAGISLFGYIKLFLVGALASATMVIPGVSGSAVLMTIGYYKPVLDILKNITDFSHLGKNLAILVPFGVGVIVGMLLIAKLINYLLKKHEVPTYYGIIGFVLASVVAIIYQNFILAGPISASISEVVVGIVLCVVGFYTAFKLGDK